MLFLLEEVLPKNCCKTSVAKKSTAVTEKWLIEKVGLGYQQACTLTVKIDWNHASDEYDNIFRTHLVSNQLWEWEMRKVAYSSQLGQVAMLLLKIQDSSKNAFINICIGPGTNSLMQAGKFLFILISLLSKWSISQHRFALYFEAYLALSYLGLDPFILGISVTK